MLKAVNIRKGMGGKMKVEGFIDEYLKKFQNGKDERNYEGSSVLVSVKQMYDALGDEKYFSFISEYLKSFVVEDGTIENKYADSFDASSVNCSKLLFFMYDKTGEEKYHNAIEAVMKLLRENPVMLSPDKISMEELYMVQPFYMEYETRYDKKAKYSDIIKQFERADNLLGAENKNIEQTCLYLISLIDALSAMSFEIYEKYRKLQDMFKLSLAGLLKCYDKENGTYCGENAGDAGNAMIADAMVADAMIAYAIIKACRMGIILKEKYAADGMEIVESLMKNKLTDIFNDTRAVGPFLSAYGQYLQLKEEMEA